MHMSSRLPGEGCSDSTTCMFSKKVSSLALTGATSTVAGFMSGVSVGDAIVAWPPGATVVSIYEGRLACAAGATTSTTSNAAPRECRRDTRRSYRRPAAAWNRAARGELQEPDGAADASG